MSNGSDPKHFRSSLAGKARGPMTGVGAGLPQNQRMAGASDPEKAARHAADPAAAKRAQETARETEAKLADRREQIFSAYQKGLIFQGDDEREIIAKLQQADQAELTSYEVILDQAEKDRIDDEERAAQQTSFRGIMINPEETGYQYLYDDALRDRIEKGLEPIDFGQMIFDGFAEQEVELNPKLKVVFRTISTQHSLWLERRIHEAHKMAEQYGRHWFSLMQLSVCVQRVNGKEIGTDLNAFDEEELEKKFWENMAPRMKKLHRLPHEITDLLIANMAWFSGRVRKEIVGDLTEKVGNS